MLRNPTPSNIPKISIKQNAIKHYLIIAEGQKCKKSDTNCEYLNHQIFKGHKDYKAKL